MAVGSGISHKPSTIQALKCCPYAPGLAMSNPTLDLADATARRNGLASARGQDRGASPLDPHGPGPDMILASATSSNWTVWGAIGLSPKGGKCAPRPGNTHRQPCGRRFRHIGARFCLAQAHPCDKLDQVARDGRGLEAIREISVYLPRPHDLPFAAFKRRINAAG